MSPAEIDAALAGIRQRLDECAGVLHTPLMPHSRTRIDRVRFCGAFTPSWPDGAPTILRIAVDLTPEDYSDLRMDVCPLLLPHDVYEEWHCGAFPKWLNASRDSTLKWLSGGDKRVVCMLDPVVCGDRATWVDVWVAPPRDQVPCKST